MTVHQQLVCQRVFRALVFAQVAPQAGFTSVCEDVDTNQPVADDFRASITRFFRCTKPHFFFFRFFGFHTLE